MAQKTPPPDPKRDDYDAYTRAELARLNANAREQERRREARARERGER
ncbi:hypothetical protein [Actinomadura atramentaria]|nr:hypothetical protein [Actinomadura atramentaria]